MKRIVFHLDSVFHIRFVWWMYGVCSLVVVDSVGFAVFVAHPSLVMRRLHWRFEGYNYLHGLRAAATINFMAHQTSRKRLVEVVDEWDEWDWRETHVPHVFQLKGARNTRNRLVAATMWSQRRRHEIGRRHCFRPRHPEATFGSDFISVSNFVAIRTQVEPHRIHNLVIQTLQCKKFNANNYVTHDTSNLKCLKRYIKVIP